MELSFWEKNTLLTNIDVVIIGSGIVGLNAAMALKKKNRKINILVLERGLFSTGASSKNAGFACFGSAGELLDDLKSHSEEELFSLVEKRWKGLQKLRKNLGDKAIVFEKLGGYEVFDQPTDFLRCKEKLSYLNTQVAQITGIKHTYRIADDQITGFGFRGINHMILNTAEGQIDTGKMMATLELAVRNLGVKLIYGIAATSIANNGNKIVVSASGLDITCNRVIIATNGFAKQLLPDYPIQPARAQVLITHPIKKLKLKGTFHFDNGYYYFRNVGNRLLLGGGRNLDFKTEETYENGLTEIVQTRLNTLLKTMIVPTTPYEVDMRWSGIMGVGPEKKSIVKCVRKNVFCAVRMGGMGIAIGTLVGEEVADLVINGL